MALGLAAMNKKGVSIGAKKSGLVSEITYYRTAGTSYKTITATSDNSHYGIDYSLNSNKIVTKFKSYLMDEQGASWVWAKKGYITYTITPAVENTKFACVRVGDSYAHSTSNSGVSSISISIGASGSVSLSANLESGKGSTVTYGKKQYIFYNNGDVVKEQG